MRDRVTGYEGLPSTGGGSSRGWAGQEGGGEGVSGILARIPSRLVEPGSLFSRYKFLQLRLVVVMVLTWTRRELLKRRTIGARATYPVVGFLEPRVTRHLLRQCRCHPPHPSSLPPPHPHYMLATQRRTRTLLFVSFVY